MRGKTHNIIEVNFLKYYFESHLIYEWSYYRQTIFNQLNIMVPNVDMIGLCSSVAILWEIHVMQHKCHVRWLRFHFKRMLITGLGLYTLLKKTFKSASSFYDSWNRKETQNQFKERDFYRKLVKLTSYYNGKRLLI